MQLMSATIFLLLPALAQALHGKDGELCPKILAALTTKAGDVRADVIGQRVEIRQCLVTQRHEIAVIQLVAWEASGTAPAIILETEERQLKQFAVSPNAFAFEMGGGSASRVCGFVFEGGKARIALRDSARAKTVISSDGESITVKLYSDEPTDPKTYLLKGSAPVP